MKALRLLGLLDHQGALSLSSLALVASFGFAGWAMQMRQPEGLLPLVLATASVAHRRVISDRADERHRVKVDDQMRTVNQSLQALGIAVADAQRMAAEADSKIASMGLGTIGAQQVPLRRAR